MRTNRQHASAGFTLIEVVLSIGLLVFAITVIMAGLDAAGRYAANNARRALAVDLLHRSFLELEMANRPGAGRSSTLGFKPVDWEAAPVKVEVWFDADGTLVESPSKAFFRCELLANKDATAALGHLHGRMVWPVRESGGRQEGNVELFTSMLLP
ncbi:MAG: type II secretion system GspH family protein [Akkermansiaceae bacterium]|nr:type II secretion system GspH family protein [Akkermansiaceae bacterium]MCF7730625.1 type II secretion system GspH family protein [Akkermansiaceae bacterium]